MRKLRYFLILMLLLTGCGGHIKQVSQGEGGSALWPYHHGNLAGLGVANDNGFTGRLPVLWETSSNDKPSGPLSLHEGALIYAGSKGEIRFFDQMTGQDLGSVGSSKRPSQTGLAIEGDLACYGSPPPRNTFACIGLPDGKTHWTQTVKDAAAGSIIIENRVVVASSEGVLYSFHLEDGQPAWRFECPARFLAPPTYADGAIYQPADDGQLLIVDAATGSERRRVELDGPLVGAVAIAELVFVADMHGQAYGIETANGEIAWRVELPGRVWTAPAVGDSLIVYGLASGDVVALRRDSGLIAWRYEAGEAIRASAIVVGRYVIVGTLAGSLLSLSLDDGTLIERRQLRGGIDKSPVSDGRRVYVSTRAGTITCFGVSDDTEHQDDQRSQPSGKPQ